MTDQADKAERLAAMLRENLKKRKAQAREVMDARETRATPVDDDR